MNHGKYGKYKIFYLSNLSIQIIKIFSPPVIFDFLDSNLSPPPPTIESIKFENIIIYLNLWIQNVNS